MADGQENKGIEPIIEALLEARPNAGRLLEQMFEYSEGEMINFIDKRKDLVGDVTLHGAITAIAIAAYMTGIRTGMIVPEGLKIEAREDLDKISDFLGFGESDGDKEIKGG